MWACCHEKFIFPYVKWEVLAVLNGLGGCGFKIVFIFSKALA
jgi:hypothetical protein